jgi:hypothetical protein
MRSKPSMWRFVPEPARFRLSQGAPHGSRRGDEFVRLNRRACAGNAEHHQISHHQAATGVGEFELAEVARKHSN